MYSQLLAFLPMGGNAAMKAVNRKAEDIVLSVVLFIAVLFGSMLGATLFGVSLNKISLIPLLVFSLYIAARNGIALGKTSAPLFAFYALAILSSLIALTASYASSYEDYATNLIQEIVQILVFYVPILMCFSNYDNKGRALSHLKKSIVYVCRINVIYSLFQFFFYAALKIDINTYLLAPFYGGDFSTLLTNQGQAGIFMRVSGFCADAAFLGLILVIGFAFERKAVFKFLIFLVAVLALSRVAIVVIVFQIVFRFIKERKYNNITGKGLLLLCLLPAAIAVAFSIESIRTQMEGLLVRFGNLFGENSAIDGSNRHLMYSSKALEILFTKYDPLQFLIGYGPRNSGTIIFNMHVMDEYLNAGMMTTVWAAESDVAELLLGYGVVGTLLYLWSLIKLRKAFPGASVVIASLLLFGIMYNISSSTFINLFLVLVSSCATETSKNRKRVARGAHF